MSEATSKGRGRLSKQKALAEQSQISRQDVVQEELIKSPKKRGVGRGLGRMSKASSRTDLDQSDAESSTRPMKKVLSSAQSRGSLRRTNSRSGFPDNDKTTSHPDSARTVVLKPRVMTAAEIEAEEKIARVLQAAIDKIKAEVTDKQIIFGKLQAEVVRMLRIFEKIQNTDLESSAESVETDLTNPMHDMTVQQRKELMEKGPFNLVFHGVEPDWIEDEMDDDPDFQRDVLEQKIKAIIRDEVGIFRDVGVIDCYRYKQGVPLGKAYPVIVTFKARKEKEQILWRAKDKLRKKEIFVTEDSQARISERLKQEKEKEQHHGKAKLTKSVSTTEFPLPRSPKKLVPPMSPKKNLKTFPMKKAASQTLTQPVKKAPAHKPAPIPKLPPSKPLSKLELDDLFDMDDDDDEDF